MAPAWPAGRAWRGVANSQTGREVVVPPDSDTKKERESEGRCSGQGALCDCPHCPLPGLRAIMMGTATPPLSSNPASHSFFCACRGHQRTVPAATPDAVSAQRAVGVDAAIL